MGGLENYQQVWRVFRICNWSIKNQRCDPLIKWWWWCMDLCWRPWGRQSDSLPDCLRTHRCCLPRQQSCVGGFWGPCPRLLSSPRSETLLENENINTALFAFISLFLNVALQQQQKSTFSSAYCNILTYIKAVDSWETLRGVGVGRSSKQIQFPFHNAEKETRWSDGSKKMH